MAVLSDFCLLIVFVACISFAFCLSSANVLELKHHFDQNAVTPHLLPCAPQRSYLATCPCFLRPVMALTPGRKAVLVLSLAVALLAAFWPSLNIHQHLPSSLQTLKDVGCPLVRDTAEDWQASMCMP